MRYSSTGSVPRGDKNRPHRFLRLGAGLSDTASLLYGCPVVDTEGQRLGRVDHLLVDAITYRLRYVVLARRKRGAVVALPWQALYFDSAQARLVFFRHDPRSGEREDA